MSSPCSFPGSVEFQVHIWLRSLLPSLARISLPSIPEAVPGPGLTGIPGNTGKRLLAQGHGFSRVPKGWASPACPTSPVTDSIRSHFPLQSPGKSPSTPRVDTSRSHRG